MRLFVCGGGRVRLVRHDKQGAVAGGHTYTTDLTCRPAYFRLLGGQRVVDILTLYTRSRGLSATGAVGYRGKGGGRGCFPA